MKILIALWRLFSMIKSVWDCSNCDFINKNFIIMLIKIIDNLTQIEEFLLKNFWNIFLKSDKNKNFIFLINLFVS